MHGYYPCLYLSIELGESKFKGSVCVLRRSGLGWVPGVWSCFQFLSREAFLHGLEDNAALYVLSALRPQRTRMLEPYDRVPQVCLVGSRLPRTQALLLRLFDSIKW